MAGDTPEDAIAAGLALHARGILSTFDLLGEDVLDRDAARRMAEANKELLRKIPADVERNVSIKLTTFGLDIADDFCLELTTGVLDAAREVGGFVRIDMEGSKHTQRTLDMFRQLRRVVRQRRDRAAGDAQAHGAGREGGDPAPRPGAAVQGRVQGAGGGRLPGDGRHPGQLPAVRATCCWSRGTTRPSPPTTSRWSPTSSRTREEKGIAPRRFEFQMLYGLRPHRWDELVASGHNVRIYVPYGTHWFPYFYRRLRERKENVFFVLRSLLGG